MHIKPSPRRFASRVQVVSSTGRYLFRAHAEYAQQLVTAGTACIDCEENKIWRICILSTPGPRKGPNAEITAHSYKTKYTVLQDLGFSTEGRKIRAFKFKKIHDADKAKYSAVQESVIMK